MAIDKIFKSSNVDDLADNILSEVDDFMVSVDKMQQRKVAGNVQKVIQAFKQIETDLQDRYDNVTDVLEKRVSTIKDGRDGVNGNDGRSGRDGKPGRDGVNGKQGTPGTPGKDGTDGVDGVSVTNANIDFDGSLVISLSTGEQINVGEVVPPELERQLVELRQGGGSAGSSGDVMGPTASTDNAIARFDGTTGKVVQNSVVTIADTTGNMAGVGTLGVGAITTTGALVGTATQSAFNTVSTTLNLGGAATTLNIGAATGTLTVANTTLAAKAITSTGLAVTGTLSATTGNLQSALTSTTTAANIVLRLASNASGADTTLQFTDNTTYNGYMSFKATTFTLTGGTLVVASGGVTSAGLLDLSAATAGQIKFPATQNASADANTLDDYEEGTWTPSIGGTATYTTQVGLYTKIGRQVTLIFNLEILLLGTGSTTTITGAPFAPALNMGNYHTGSVYWETIASSQISVGTFIQQSTAEIYFYTRSTAGTSAVNVSAIIGSGTILRGTLTYFV